MPHLATLHRQENLDLNARTLWREAVRGIVQRNGKLLMVYSPVNDDYKFPGGGVEPGEEHTQALARELREESGAYLLEVLGAFGKVLEYGPAIEAEFDIFAMHSYYYLCRVGDELVFEQQLLDEYERELGFQPLWIDARAALEHNQALLHNADLPTPRWLRREIFVLKKLISSSFST